jgi:hypothetical protein
MDFGIYFYVVLLSDFCSLLLSQTLNVWKIICLST